MQRHTSFLLRTVPRAPKAFFSVLRLWNALGTLEERTFSKRTQWDALYSTAIFLGRVSHVDVTESLGDNNGIGIGR